jgi:ring-1,2-phenylacetyl-CoA epoxidase subunit PaaC
VGAARDRAGAAVPDEDVLAYFRDADEFRCSALVAAPNGDFAHTVVRLLVASTWRLALAARLRQSRDPVLAAVAAKAVPELTYHRDHAARWVLRLGDGTPESHRRAQLGAEAVWPLTADLFSSTDVERRLAHERVGLDPAELRDEVRDVLTVVLTRATIAVPPWPDDDRPRGRGGDHGPELAELLEGLQGLARTHPGATW